MKDPHSFLRTALLKGIALLLMLSCMLCLSGCAVASIVAAKTLYDDASRQSAAVKTAKPKLEAAKSNPKPAASPAPKPVQTAKAKTQAPVPTPAAAPVTAPVNAVNSNSKPAVQTNTVDLKVLSPINGGFLWNEGDPRDPFGNVYTGARNFAILHSDGYGSNHYWYSTTHLAEYQLDRKYDVLSFTVMPYADFGEDGWAYIRIYTEKGLRYTTDKIVQKTQPYQVSVDISDADYVKILVYNDKYSCIMLTDAMVSKVPGFSSKLVKGYTSLSVLEAFNGSLPWEEDYPSDTIKSDYKQVGNYAVLHAKGDAHNYAQQYSAEYYTNNQYASISLNIAPAEDFAQSGTANVKLYADDVLVYTSPTIIQKTARFSTGQIDVSKAKYVKLVADVNRYSCIIVSDVLLKDINAGNQTQSLSVPVSVLASPAGQTTTVGEGSIPKQTASAGIVQTSVQQGDVFIVGDIAEQSLTVDRRKKQEGPIEIGQYTHIVDELLGTEQDNLYLFNATVDGTYRFDVSRMSSRYGIMSIEVYDSAMKRIDSGRDSMFIHLDAGTYTVSVRSLSDTCSYTLKIGYQKPTYDVSAYSVIRDRITYKSQRNCYQYVPKTTGEYQLSLSCPDDLRFRLYVYDANMEAVAKETYASSKKGLSATLMQGETYDIAVAQYDGYGAYDLSIEPK